MRFQWKGNLYEFLCLHFDLPSTLRIFTKLMKIPTSVLRKLRNRIIIYLDDMHLMGAFKGLLMTCCNVIYLLQRMGFLINIKGNSIGRHIGVVVNSHNVTLSLPKEKILKIQLQCKLILSQSLISIRTKSNFFGTTGLCNTTLFKLSYQITHLRRS